MFTTEVIQEYIPHRPPFLLIDEILSIEEGVRATSLKRIREDDLFLAGHFPGYPIMPGVLIVENMAQTANFLVSYSARATLNDDSQLRHLLGMVRKMHFRSSARPGDDLVTQVEVVKLFSNMGIVDCLSKVENRIVAKGQLMFGATKG